MPKATDSQNQAGTMPPHSSSRRVPAAVWRTYQVASLFIGIMLSVVWTSLWTKSRPHEEVDAIWQGLFKRQAVRFRMAAERLGGLVIKVGQFLSSRVDLMPKPVIEELQKLQDNVSPAPWPIMRDIVVNELGPLDQNFITFDENSIAAASLGQVYSAHLLDGTHVAVKIQRPEIQRIVAADLSALSLVVAMLTRFTSFGQTFDLFTVLREFRRMVHEELDYHHELENTETLRDALRDVPYVTIPRTYPDFCTSRVLVMEFRHGVKINQHAGLVDAHINPTLVAERAIRLYLHMVMDLGIYHADPHPGNLLVTDSGGLILLDFGMVGHLDNTTKRQLRRMFVAIAERNPSDLVESLHGLGMVRPRANRARLKRMVHYLLDRYYAETLNQLADLDIPALLRDFESLLRDDAIQVPGEFAFLGRAIAILIGLAISLDPSINLVTLFAPFARRFVTEEDGGATAFAVQRIQKWAQTTLDLPITSHRVLRQIELGDIEARVEWPQGREELARLKVSIRGLTQAIYLVGLSAAGAWLWGQGRLGLARIFFGLAVGIWVIYWIRGRR